MELAKYAGMGVYDGIRDIMDVPHFDESRDEALMDSLGHVLVRYNVHDVLGINLLHTHFDISFDEILIQIVAPDQIVSYPVRLETIGKPIHPMTWRVQNGSPVPLHWRVGVDPAFDRVQVFLNGPGLAEIRALLGDQIERFGVIRISECERRLVDGLVMLEQSDIQNRILISNISKDADSSIQTAWYFSSSEEMQASARCDAYCRSYCYAICTWERGGDTDSGSQRTGGHFSDGHGTNHRDGHK